MRGPGSAAAHSIALRDARTMEFLLDVLAALGAEFQRDWSRRHRRRWI
jgi:hypothetical protein